MAKTARSARGVQVDFDILQIKQALASAPINVGTEERRQFIDSKNGLKPSKQTKPILQPNLVQEVPNALRDIMKSITPEVPEDFDAEPNPLDQD
jgi:hypothetical protein